MANAYPTFSDSSKEPRVQRAQKEEKLSKLKEIEDNDDEEGMAWVHCGLNKDF